MINFDKYTKDELKYICSKLEDHIRLLELINNDISLLITSEDIQEWLDQAFIILNNGELNEKNITGE